MATYDQQDEEHTFGAYAHGGSGEDRHLTSQGSSPAPREQAEPQAEGTLGGEEGGRVQLPSQASLPEVPASCAEAQHP